MRILKTIHNAIITLFMALAYPIVAILSLIAMAIRFDGFCTIKELNGIWADAIKVLWTAKE